MGRSGVAYHTALARRGCNRKETLIRRCGENRPYLRGDNGKFKLTGNLRQFLTKHTSWPPPSQEFGESNGS